MDIKIDQAFDDPEVEISQILMKVFLLGMVVGKGQLQDDANASGSPIGQVLGQLQQQFEQLMPGSSQAAQSNAYGNFAKNMLDKKALDIYKREQAEKVLDIYKKEQTEKEEKVKVPNQNLTLNDKRLNDQHDVIVRTMLESLEDEAKQTVANIVKETKIFKK